MPVTMGGDLATMSCLLPLHCSKRSKKNKATCFTSSVGLPFQVISSLLCPSVWCLLCEPSLSLSFPSFPFVPFFDNLFHSFIAVWTPQTHFTQLQTGLSATLAPTLTHHSSLSLVLAASLTFQFQRSQRFHDLIVIATHSLTLLHTQPVSVTTQHAFPF